MVFLWPLKLHLLNPSHPKIHSLAKAHAKSLNALRSVPGCSLVTSSTGCSFGWVGGEGHTWTGDDGWCAGYCASSWGRSCGGGWGGSCWDVAVECDKRCHWQCGLRKLCWCAIHIRIKLKVWLKLQNSTKQIHHLLNLFHLNLPKKLSVDWSLVGDLGFSVVCVVVLLLDESMLLMLRALKELALVGQQVSSIFCWFHLQNYPLPFLLLWPLKYSPRLCWHFFFQLPSICILFSVLLFLVLLHCLKLLLLYLGLFLLCLRLLLTVINHYTLPIPSTFCLWFPRENCFLTNH